MRHVRQASLHRGPDLAGPGEAVTQSRDDTARGQGIEKRRGSGDLGSEGDHSNQSARSRQDVGALLGVKSAYSLEGLRPCGGWIEPRTFQVQSERSGTVAALRFDQ